MESDIYTVSLIKKAGYVLDIQQWWQVNRVKEGKGKTRPRIDRFEENAFA